MAEMKAGVLRGINVLDFGRHVAGGFCARVLADMGARVIKIEAPITGDHIRLMGPFHGESWLMPPTISPIFLHCNAGKESLALDLKKPESIGLIKRLIAHMDVVLENFTPHVMPGLGLAYDDLRRIREDIVMCSISGFGAEGPLADTVANDPVIQAIIEEFLQTFDTAEAAFQAMSEAKILAGIVLDPWEAASHPQTVQRDMMREVHHPYAGALSILAAAPRFSRNETTVGRAPFAGEHNRPVLREFLGLSDEEMDHLQESGALFEDVTVAHLDVMP